MAEVAQQETTALIVNPNARGGFIGRKWPVLEPILREALGGFSVHFTKAPGEGTALCQQALAAGAGLVLALGGDGTASEVAAGFLVSGANRREQPPSFGFLPCGTGGDLRRTYGSPADLAAAARAIREARPRAIDVGQLDYIGHDGQPRRGHFINVASCGIGGLVDALVNQARSKQLLGGTLTFFTASLRATLRYRNVRCAIRLDDGPEREVRLYDLVVANGRFFGGGMHIAPQAQVDDGLFDVVTMGDFTFLELLPLSRRIYKGEHLSHRKIEMARARTVTARPVDAADEVLLDVDGEAPGRLPATFTLLPGALLLRV